MNRAWQLAKRYWFDAVVLVGLGTCLAGAVVGQGDSKGPEGPLWFDVLAVLASILPFFARRRFPFGALVTVGASIGAASFVDGRLVPFVFPFFFAGCAGAFLFGLLRNRRQAIAGLAVVVAAEFAVNHNDRTGHFGDAIFITLVFSAIWVVAFAMGHKLSEADRARERAAAAERAREEEARLAVAEERARIARELHDIVGHSVSVMTVQAAGVRRLLRPDQEREREALLVVEQTGREALAEMRRLVGALRHPEEAPALAPQPSLDHVDKLVEQAREAGLPVELHVKGTPVELPAGVDLTAYRVIQEGLTNAVKHARAKRAQVLVRYDDGHVEVTVSDDGTGDGGGPKGGHGLVGMRERVAVYGGEIEAGPRPQGGFALRARLPLSSD